MPPSSEAAGPPSRTRARVLGSYVDGWRRTLRAPAVVFGTLTATILAALTVALDQPDWTTAASELARRVRIAPEVYGAGSLQLAALLPDLSGWWYPGAGVIGSALGALLLWIFLSGGLLDRLARDRPIGVAAFFAACGVFFFRFLRLDLIAIPVYWVLLQSFAAWDDDWGLLALVVTAGAVMVIIDIAKTRAVVEDRRSMIGALLASIRFVRRRPLRLLGLHVLHLMTVAAVASLWSFTPALESAPANLVAMSLYLLLHLYLRLALSGAQIAFFQGELAHAEYSAAPLPIWPDSPAAESIDNFLERRH